MDAHVALMTRSETLTEEDLIAVARDLGIPLPDPGKATETDERAKARVQADVKSAQVSHALVTPTFFINGRRYDDPWMKALSLMRCSVRQATDCGA